MLERSGRILGVPWVMLPLAEEVEPGPGPDGDREFGELDGEVEDEINKDEFCTSCRPCSC